MLIADMKGEYPSYFIYGPLVFSKATQEFLALISNNVQMLSALSFLGNPMITRRGDAPSADQEELVIVSSPLFPHKLSKGYGNPPASVVDTINGTHVRSLSHLVALLRDLKDDFVTFEFDQRNGEALIFARKEMVDATEEILNDNGVRTQGSPDLMEVWQGKRAE